MSSKYLSQCIVWELLMNGMKIKTRHGTFCRSFLNEQETVLPSLMCLFKWDSKSEILSHLVVQKSTWQGIKSWTVHCPKKSLSSDALWSLVGSSLHTCVLKTPIFGGICGCSQVEHIWRSTFWHPDEFSHGWYANYVITIMTTQFTRKHLGKWNENRDIIWHNLSKTYILLL